MKSHLRSFVILLAPAWAIGCSQKADPSATEALRVAASERLLPGRFEFREFGGWMVRFDTAKGTYCSVENISDREYSGRLLKDGKAIAEASVPGGTCTD
jgi:hypothetical protein